MNKIVRTAKAPTPKGPYSQAVISGGFVYVAGQVAIDPETNEFEFGTVESETELTFKNIKAILGSAGCKLKDVVRVGVYLKNMSSFPAMNKIYSRYFPHNPPARSTVGVELVAGLKVEIDCVAKLPRKAASKKKLKGGRDAKTKAKKTPGENKPRKFGTV